MKRNKTKRRILVGSIFLLLGLISSIAPNSVGGMVMTPNIYFVRACDPPYDLECLGEYEPLLGAGLYATESCVMEYSELGFYELFQGAAYASNGESLIAVASGTGSMWLANMHRQPCYTTHILWPFMVVRKDGNPIPAEHDPIPMALKYQVGLSGIGMFCSNAQLEVLTSTHTGWTYHLGRVNWTVGYPYCNATIKPQVWNNIEGDWVEAEPSDYIYFTCSQEDVGSIFIDITNWIFHSIWTNNYLGINCTYTEAMSIAHAYLLIDPNWEHADEYEVLTLKDLDAPVDDPTSWVQHIDTSIDSVSTEFSWGFNLYGQLGDGSTDNRSTPIQVIDPSEPTGSLSNVVEIAAENHSLALKADGTVWAWGLNDYGQLGDGTQVRKASPVQVIDPSYPTGNLINVTDIACGAAHSLALKADGTVWTWGLNDYGQLGDGSQDDKTYPVQVSGLTDVMAIAGGGFHSLALKSDGTIWAWGRNDHGQLGDGTNVDSSTPVQVVDSSNPPMPFTGVQVVAAGGFTNLALKSDGSVWAWGYNNNGQLGDGSSIDRWFPVQVIDPIDSTGYLTNVMDIAAGASHHLALKTDRTVWTWGYNGRGQLGDGTQMSKTSPVQVLGLTEVVAIAGGAGHSLGLKSDGTVWAWGYNMQGQLGNGTTTDSSIPVQVIDPSDPTGKITNVVAIAGGAGHSVGLKSITSTDYTAEGTYVEVRPVDAATGTSPVTLTFDNVPEPGITSLSTSTGGPPPSEGFMLGTPPTYYYLMTTATYTGQIEVCIDYSGVSFDEAPDGLYHYENGEWVDVTTSHEGSVICSRVSSLSPFALFEPSPIVVSGPACVNVGKGKGKMANKLTVSANENYYKEVYVTIDKVEIFNNGGQAVKGKGVYEIDGNDIYVYPKGKGWSLCVTVMSKDVNGRTLKTEQVCRFLEKCKK